jgi:hypothetical protein
MSTNGIAFGFSTDYDAREVEDLLEALERRGTKCRLRKNGTYHLYIPPGLDSEPFRLTLQDCESVAWCSSFAHPVPIAFEEISVEFTA